MLQALRDSDGTGVAVSDRHILEAQQMLAQREGMFVSLEAAATIAAVGVLVLGAYPGPVLDAAANAILGLVR